MSEGVHLPLLESGWIILGILLLLSSWMWCLILLKGVQFYCLRRKELELGHCLRTFRAGNLPDGWQRRVLAVIDLGGEQRLLEQGEQVARQIGRHVSTILVLAQVAPLLGLIGTVIGMISTFDAIAHFGTGNLGALADGISEALLTTQGGLLVAIPGLLVGTLLRRRADAFRDRIEAFCLAAGRELTMEADRV